MSRMKVTINAQKFTVNNNAPDFIVTTEAIQGPPGPSGNSSVALIDDVTPQLGKAYSSKKTEDRLSQEMNSITDTIGNTETDLVVYFENILSQGGI